jgi:hypothetical protein
MSEKIEYMLYYGEKYQRDILNYYLTEAMKGGAEEVKAMRRINQFVKFESYLGRVS